MKTTLLPLSVLLLLTACHTSIAHVTFPTPTTIKGEIIELSDDGFVLKDATGTIEVDVDDYDFGNKLVEGDTVTVKGVLDEDDSVGKSHIVAEEFDAYSVIPKSGFEIVIVPYSAGHPSAKR